MANINSESKTDSLYALIKSLTKSEKAYFKKFTSIYSSGKSMNYLRLFDLLEKMETYNQKLFEKKAIEYSLSNNLSVNKNYLYGLILRSMNTLYSNENSENEIMELIKNYRFLSKKKLNSQAYKMLNRAKTFAKENEMIPEQFLILNDERIQYANENRNTLPSQLNKLHGEFEKLLNILNKECRIGIIYFDTYQLMSTDGVARNKEILNELTSKLKEAKEIKESNSPETFIFNLRYNTFFESYYFLTHDFEEAAKYSKAIINLYEKYPNKKNEKIKGYVGAINNFLNATLRIPDFNSAKTALIKLEALLDSNSASEIFINERLYHFKLLFYLNQGNYFGAGETVDEIIKWLSANENNLNKSKLLILYYDLSQYYFGIKDLKKALYYNNKILNEFNEMIYNDFLTESRILHLLIHYDLKDFDYLKYNMVSMYRRLPKDKDVLKTERLTVRYLNKLILSNGGKLIIMNDFYKKISSLLNDPFEKFLIEETRIKYWIKSKMEKRTMPEVISTSLSMSDA